MEATPNHTESHRFLFYIKRNASPENVSKNVMVECAQVLRFSTFFYISAKVLHVVEGW